MKNNAILSFLVLFLITVSCSSNVDFDQANNFTLEPVIVANLTYFDIPARDFVTNGVEQNFAFDALDFDVFRDAFFKENLNRADFFFEINNTINRAYSIQIILLDQADQPLYTIQLDVPAYNGTENKVMQTEVFEGAKLDLLKSTKRLAFLINMAAGPAITEDTAGSLKLRSSATVYLEIK
jgi:hypothetical protein